ARDKLIPTTKSVSRCGDHGHSIESVRGGPTGGSNRCDPNATRHGKRPLSARCLQRKQTALKSANIMCVCKTPGSRSRIDARLLNLPMGRRNSLSDEFATKDRGVMKPERPPNPRA